MKRFVGLLVIGMILLGGLPCFAASTSVDALIKKLVDKGILSEKEARELKTEIVSDEKALREEGYKQGLPTWIQDAKLKGDFRLRLQSNFPKVGSDQTNVRTRGRIRMRLGIDTKANDKVAIGIGLATGLNTAASSTDVDTSRSPNQTLGDSFGKKPISLDYAYAQYTPAPWAMLTGGRFKNPVWEPSDMLWDTDISPEGLSFNFTKPFGSKTNFFMNTLVGIVDEINSEGDDPMLYVIQPGFQYQLTNNVSVKNALAYHVFYNVKGRLLDGSAGTNTGLSGSSPSVTGTLKYGYTPLNPSMEIAIRDPLKRLNLTVPSFIDIPTLSVFGEYVDNLSLRKHTDENGAKNNTGFSTGFKLGAEKVGNVGQWQFKYIYLMLEKDAVPDILSDSDRYSGRTGIRSHEGILEVGLGKNVSFALDVYRSWRLGIKSAQLPETVGQADFNFKF